MTIARERDRHCANRGFLHGPGPRDGKLEGARGSLQVGKATFEGGRCFHAECLNRDVFSFAEVPELSRIEGEFQRGLPQCADVGNRCKPCGPPARSAGPSRGEVNSCRMIAGWQLLRQGTGLRQEEPPFSSTGWSPVVRVSGLDRSARRLGGLVEGLEGLSDLQPAEADTGGDPPFVLALDLAFEHPVEQRHRAQILPARLLLIPTDAWACRASRPCAARAPGAPAPSPAPAEPPATVASADTAPPPAFRRPARPATAKRVPASRARRT